MNACSVIVIGGSAGSIEALKEIVSAFPASLPAAVCIVVHVSPHGHSALAEILGRRCRLPVSQAADGEPLRPGRVYVAPPDRHLLIHDGTLCLLHGPKEHYTRPAVDPLFRTAASSFDGRVTGVVLSGALGDGALGLAEVKAFHGKAIVQDPEQAYARSMPDRAMRACEPDFVLPVSEIGPKLVELALESPGDHAGGAQEVRAAVTADREGGPGDGMSRTDSGCLPGKCGPECGSPQTCPDCGGILHAAHHSAATAYRCGVGHVFDAEELLLRRAGVNENLIWAAVTGLREEESLAHAMAEEARHLPAGRRSARDPGELERQAKGAGSRAAALQALFESDV